MWLYIYNLIVMFSRRPSVGFHITPNGGLEKILFALFVVEMLEISAYVVQASLKFTVLLPQPP